jgi:hypothetical protein
MIAQRGLSRVDLVATLAALMLIATLIAIGTFRGRGESRKQKEGDQLRSLHQAFITFGQGGNDEYVVPSRIDRANYTLDLPAAAKDTTSNIYSPLVFFGSIKVEVLVSPAETNPSIRPYRDYQYDAPSGAARPDQATWDPKLSAVLDGSVPGHVSYAHMQVFGGRKPKWSNSFSASEAVLSNRAPEISSVTRTPDSSVTPTLANPASNTLRFYGRGRTWSGWTAFNDNHVDFRSDYLKNRRPFKPVDGMRYTNDAGKQATDIWCYDELDDSKAANDYIGIFLKAGAKREDWKAAWD